MKDWRDTEIEAGDTIVYAVKESTQVLLHEATVTEVTTARKYSWDDEMVPVVKARWLRSSLYGEWRIKKDVVLRSPENITVVKKHGESMVISWNGRGKFKLEDFKLEDGPKP